MCVCDHYCLAYPSEPTLRGMTHKFSSRNDDLYETTTTTTTTQAPPQIIFIDRPRPIRGPGRIRPTTRRRPFGGKRGGGRRTTTTTTTTPQPEFYDEYYYDYYPYYDEYYNDYANERTTTTTTTQRPRRLPNRQRGTRPGAGGGRFRGGFNVREGKRPRLKPSVRQDGGDPPQDTTTGARRRLPGRPGSKTGPQRQTTTTTEAPADYYYDYYYDYVEEKSTTTTTAAPSRRVRPSRKRPGETGQRTRSGRPDPTVATTTSTTTKAPLSEEPSGNRGRPSHVNTRRNPVITRRVSQIEPEETVAEAPPAQRQRPQRTGPKFPSRRPQGDAQAAPVEAEIVEEEAPLAPGVRLSPYRTPNDRTAGGAAAPEESPRVRRPRPGRQGSQRPSGRRRVQARDPAPDYYEY